MPRSAHDAHGSVRCTLCAAAVILLRSASPAPAGARRPADAARRCRRCCRGSRPPTATCWRSPKRTAGSCALLVAARGAKRVLEIGGANGYSAIWIGLGLRETGGRLVTIEYDPQRARDAEANIRAAGLSDIVQVIPGDAFAAIPKLAGTFDFVFCDAWKKDYQRFFDMVFPRLDKGGVFVAHNVVNKASEMGDFLTTIRTHPGILSAIVSPSGEGVSVSVKR